MTELPEITSIYFDPTTDFGFKKLFGEEANKDFNKKPHQLTNHFDKWCYFLKNLQNFDTMPSILNQPVFVKAFDAAKVSNMSKGDYILYQISKSKKYDMELVEEEAKRRGMEEGKIEEREKNILALYHKDYQPKEISDMLEIPLNEVMDIIKNSVENSPKNK